MMDLFNKIANGFIRTIEIVQIEEPVEMALQLHEAFNDGLTTLVGLLEEWKPSKPQPA